MICVQVVLIWEKMTQKMAITFRLFRNSLAYTICFNPQFEKMLSTTDITYSFRHFFLTDTSTMLKYDMPRKTPQLLFRPGKRFSTLDHEIHFPAGLAPTQIKHSPEQAKQSL